MKKILVLITVILFTLSLSGCATISDLIGMESELEKALNHFNESENVTVSMVMLDVPYVGSISATMKIDGNRMEITTTDSIEYSFIKDEQTFKLVELNGKYLPIKDNSADELEDNPFAAIEETGGLDLELFEEDESTEGLYIYKGDIDGFEEFKLQIEDDIVTRLVLKVELFDETISLNMDFKNYDETIVDFPEGTVDVDRFIDAAESLNAKYGITFRGGEIDFYQLEGESSLRCTATTCVIEATDFHAEVMFLRDEYNVDTLEYPLTKSQFFESYSFPIEEEFDFMLVIIEEVL